MRMDSLVGNAVPGSSYLEHSLFLMVIVQMFNT